MERLEDIKNGMRSDIQEERPSWEDIEWLIEQVEMLIVDRDYWKQKYLLIQR